MTTANTSSPSKSETKLSRSRAKKRVTLVAALVNLVLATGKVTVGIIGQSQSLVADGIHSFSDLLTDLFALVVIKYSGQGADKDHPYGHERFETVATVILGIFLIVVAVGIIWDGVHQLADPTLLKSPGYLALMAAAVSIVSNELLFHYTRTVARNTRSKLLEANAWHHRTDAISSVIVVGGVAGTMMGYFFLDSAAAAIVGLFIAKIGFDLVLESTRELVDTSLPELRVNELSHAILSTGGVEGLHLLRTRHMGGNALIDVHILVNPEITVSEGHVIADAVRDTLVEDFEEVSEVLVHVDSEDDKDKPTGNGLLLRQDLLAEVEKYWQDVEVARDISKIYLHYQKGKVELEVFLPWSLLEDRSITAIQVEQYLSSVKDRIECVSDVKVCFIGNNETE
ncbi:MAG: cation diffusion facilitator family transporter [Methylococcales bacterium]